MDYPFFIFNCNDKREKVIIKSSVSQKDTKDDILYMYRDGNHKE